MLRTVVKIEYDGEETATQGLEGRDVHLRNSIIGITSVIKKDPISVKAEDEADMVTVKQELDIGPTLLQPKAILQRLSPPNETLTDPRPGTSAGAAVTPATLRRSEFDGGTRQGQDNDGRVDFSDDDVSPNRTDEIKKRRKEQNKIRCQRYRDKKRATNFINLYSKQTSKIVVRDITCQNFYNSEIAGPSTRNVPYVLPIHAPNLSSQNEPDVTWSHSDYYDDIHHDTASQANYVPRSDERIITIYVPVTRNIPRNVQNGIQLKMSPDVDGRKRRDDDDGADSSDDGAGRNAIDEMEMRRKLQNRIRCRRYRDKKRANSAVGPREHRAMTVDEEERIRLRKQHNREKSQRYRDRKRAAKALALPASLTRRDHDSCEEYPGTSLDADSTLDTKRANDNRHGISNGQSCGCSDDKKSSVDAQDPIEPAIECDLNTGIPTAVEDVSSDEKGYGCCNCCYRTARKSSSLNRMRPHTGAEEPYKYGPIECTTSRHFNYFTMKEIDSTQTDGKPFKCERCEYSASKLNILKKHMRVHTGERPHKCERCEYRASELDHLKRHHRRHTGEKPYKCDECGYSASHSVDLKIHTRIHTGETPPFKCEQCDYSTSRLGHLKRHVCIHSDVKPYKCEECDYNTHRLDRLKVHTLTHTGVKPFKCEKCEYSASRRSHLKLHIRTHMRKKTHKYA